MPLRARRRSLIGTAAIIALATLGACGDAAAPATPIDTAEDAAPDTAAQSDAVLDDTVAASADTLTGGDIAPDTQAGADTVADVEPTWFGGVRQFMADYCVACHSSGDKDFRSYDSAVAKRAPIRCGVAPSTQPGCGAWPPPNQFPVGDGPKPSDSERQMIVDWVDAGTPEGIAP